MTDFAAIDFETANGHPSSVCSVGVVVVRGGVVADTFYSLIHPEPDYYSWFCSEVHGLGHEDTDTAPSFPTVWRQVEPLIAGLPLVAHNSPFDERCLRAAFRVYGWTIPTTLSTAPAGPRGGISDGSSPTTSCTPLPVPAAIV